MALIIHYTRYEPSQCDNGIQLSLFVWDVIQQSFQQPNVCHCVLAVSKPFCHLFPLLSMRESSCPLSELSE